MCLFRLDSQSLGRATMDYEAPLMPCGCILLLPVRASRALGVHARNPRRGLGPCGGVGVPGRPWPRPRRWGATPGNPGEDGRLPGASGSLSTAGAGGGDMVPDPAPWSASWLRCGLRFPEATPRTPAGRGQRSWSSPQGLNWGLSLEASQGGDEHRSKDSPSLLDPFLGLALSQSSPSPVRGGCGHPHFTAENTEAQRG